MLRTILDSSVVVIQLLLAFLPALRGAIMGQYKDKLDGHMAVITLQLTVLLCYFALRNIVDRNRSEALLRQISATHKDLGQLFLSRSEVIALHEEKFYAKFRTAVESAAKAVAISHLDTKPPVRRKGSEEAAYYKAFHELVRVRTNVRFQRIERVSPQKIAWLSELVKAHEGHHNFSLSCITSEPEKRKLPYVSVQIVDEETTFLVAIAEHYDPHTERDILIHDVKATSLWREYYKGLWSSALPVIEDGRLNAANWKLIQEKMGGI